MPAVADGWIGLAVAVAAALAWDGWALSRRHQCASSWARHHPAKAGLFLVGLAAHFWAPGAHRWDPLHLMSVRLSRKVG